MVLGRNVLARELCAQGLDLVEIKDLDALLVAPGAQHLRGRSGAGDRDGVVERVHADDGLKARELLCVLEEGSDVVGCVFVIREYRKWTQ